MEIAPSSNLRGEMLLYTSISIRRSVNLLNLEIMFDTRGVESLENSPGVK